jgi:hypothetical protein
MDNVILMSAMVAVQQLFAAAALIFENVPTNFEERMQNKRKES